MHWNEPSVLVQSAAWSQLFVAAMEHSFISAQRKQIWYSWKERVFKFYSNHYNKLTVLYALRGKQIFLAKTHCTTTKPPQEMTSDIKCKSSVDICAPLGRATVLALNSVGGRGVELFLFEIIYANWH